MCSALLALFAHAARAGVAPIQTIRPLIEDFEDTLRGRYVSESINCGGCGWSVMVTQAHSVVRSVHTEVGTAGEARWVLIGLAIPADATAATLTFWQLYDFEFADPFYYDGGVLEVSTDGGEQWVDAGPNITVNGYNGVISATGNGNPLEGRAGWVGSPIGWMQVTVDLLPYRGPSLSLRWNLGSDAGNIGAPGGWWIDDIEIAYQAPPPSCTGAWNNIRPYPIAAQEVTVTSHNGTLYAFGGRTTAAVADAYRFSDQGDMWSPVARLPEPRYAAAAVSDGTYIYVLGGATSETEVHATLWRYDPVADEFVTLAPYTTATARHGAAYVDGVVYRIAGATDPDNADDTDSVEAYSIAGASWGAVADYPRALHGLTTLALDGYIYTAGGVDIAGETGAQTFRYDPGADTWADDPIANLPAEFGYAAGALYHGNWIILGSNARALGWNPLTNDWRSLDLFISPQRRFGVGATRDVLYVIGGSNGVAPLDLVRRYADDDCGPSTPTPTPPIQAATPTTRPATPTAAAATPTAPGATPTAPAATATSSGATPTATVVLTPGVCPGDCDGNGEISIAELIRGVAIALNRQPVSSCPAVDADGDSVVRVGELIAAVNRLLDGCP